MDSQTIDTMPDEDTLFDLAELFKIFGDSSRIKILFALFEKEMAVNELSAFLSMTQSAVSHQLRILKTNGLVKFRRDGKSLIYSLADGHVTSILSQGLDHIGE
ncbi:MAG: metalloregulator ArsR/SmtB family transcription factor [Treponema porcinum]|nr:metalloregulator ArsR/SmtB family transcription factor [Treponema porcinum]MCI6179306.1 metalloregulator ArsR/SmtB family transcription factor [Treponema porcinum]MCI6984008.1 metalloregulator ArsR/SmtB family transcription factor [Treponema porcinum]MCI7534502.1 metalloregulator ArsR/SmtB family transcription factor [Treponema porcinum]MCI7546809.1 metalloregulator ArsR/SmtB family transcription factor [Treponema porcinum]MDY4189593.1 metalloregulator ArsR/SmtB family transcription factor 